MKLMNASACGPAAYQPTTLEHVANIITHAICVVPSIFCAMNLVDKSKNDVERRVALTYGIGLVGLFCVSTIFHTICSSGVFRFLKELFHRSDRAMIYVFIATAYTPWLFLKPIPVESWSVHLRWGIWCLAFAGVTYQQLYHEKFKMVETIFYVFVGVVPSVSALEMEDSSGMYELLLGGLVYLTGIFFFKMDGKIPFAHAIWHLFVAVGSFIHYRAVLGHLIEKK